MTNDKAYITQLIDTYGQEFMDEVLPDFTYSEFGHLECMVLYGFLRDKKPQYAVEIGTEIKGRTSSLIQRALRKNDNFKMHLLCDRTGIVEPTISYLQQMKLGDKNTAYLSGHIQLTYKALELEKNPPDFLLIDADHGDDFARFYLDKIIALLPQGTDVMIHDMNLSGDWHWRILPGAENSEAKEFVTRREQGIFSLEPVSWLEDWCINPDYEADRNALCEKFPYIGKFPAYEFPYSSSSSYWKKI